MDELWPVDRNVEHPAPKPGERRKAILALAARKTVLAWAASPGFAAIHNGEATNEAITDHLIDWLRGAGFEIVATK